MKPAKHKKLILKHITNLREAVCQTMKEEHIRWPPKNLREVELDINDVIHEIERTELLKGN